MRLHVGTSGFSYRQWKGPFYPEKLPAGDMLAFYAERLSAVEINNTFYRSPKREHLERWATLVPDDFVFVLKAPKRITHRARLRDVEEPVGWLWDASEGLGVHRGPVLFQLPPSFRKDVELLGTFLGRLPAGLVPVLEFRHGSWDDDEVRAVLREHDAALCLADTDGAEERPIVPTCRIGYLRLRRGDYSAADLRRWAGRVRGQAWDDAFVFFKHEDEGAAPRQALAFAEAFAAG